MRLPVSPPVAPMLAKLTRELPREAGYFYEPKWDGFRCIVFRDGDEVELGSRNEKPLTRYFPELVEALRARAPRPLRPRRRDRDRRPRRPRLRRVVAADPPGRVAGPTSSRRRRPPRFVAFDLLALDDAVLHGRALRRAAHGRSRRPSAKAKPPVHLTPVDRGPRRRRATGSSRFEGAGLDGVIAKPADVAYLPDKRAMLKVKHQRTADCVVAGFRTHKDGAGVGSLLLGLFDGDGVLHHVGVASGFSVARRSELVSELEPYRAGALEHHPWASWAGEGAGHEGSGRMPGGPNRWNAGKDMTWEPVRTELVCEVSYDHLQEARFRHAASFVRWRPDREPASCTYAQLDAPVPFELAKVFGTR